MTSDETTERLPANATSANARDPNFLPEYADQWMAQWRSAAIELAKFRDWELSQLSTDQSGAAGLIENTAPPGDENQAWSGLVIQQRWFMRQRLLELEAYRRNHESRPHDERAIETTEKINYEKSS